jgi:hypothetical protein
LPQPIRITCLGRRMSLILWIKQILRLFPIHVNATTRQRRTLGGPQGDPAPPPSHPRSTHNPRKGRGLSRIAQSPGVRPGASRWPCGLPRVPERAAAPADRSGDRSKAIGRELRLDGRPPACSVVKDPAAVGPSPSISRSATPSEAVPSYVRPGLTVTDRSWRIIGRCLEPTGRRRRTSGRQRRAFGGLRPAAGRDRRASVEYRSEHHGRRSASRRHRPDLF